MTKHSHYHKDVSRLLTIDVYAVCDLFEVRDASGATQHAIKKLLCAGQRGVKSQRQDLQEAVDTLARRIQMLDEAAGLSASAIDDDSPRAVAIGQNGNTGEHYLEFCPHCGVGSPFPHKTGCPRGVSAA